MDQENQKVMSRKKRKPIKLSVYSKDKGTHIIFIDDEKGENLKELQDRHEPSPVNGKYGAKQVTLTP